MEATLKKNILIGIAAAAGLLLLAALGWLLYFKSQFILYQDSQFKFAIKYPQNWQVIPRPRPNVPVIFLRPKDTALDTVQENFNVTVQALPNDISTIEDFSARIKKQVIGTFGKSIQLVGDKSLQWGWRKGHEIIIEAPTPDHLKMVCAWVLRDTQVYIMTFIGDMNKYSQDSMAINEMIHSLQLQ
jgi:hypothetical protein